jgi:Amt family ammonium transporter
MARRSLATGAFLVLLSGVLFAQAPAAPNPIDTGDTGFMLLSAALVMLMTPGLAFFYGGMVRSKNALGTIMHSFMAVALIS